MGNAATKNLALIAIGGNSLIKDDLHKDVASQYEAICETATHIADIIEKGYDVVITHGNGPQVGFILRRSEIAQAVEGLHPIPLVSCGADIQGALGYQIQQAMDNEFRKRGMDRIAVSLVTQVVVGRNDPAFGKPAKPIGSFYADDVIRTVRAEHPDWVMVNDSGRGWRRVVASPEPEEILETKVVQDLLEKKYCVVAAGGGGIPVLRGEDGFLEGVDAVVDKDFASSLLASSIGADVLIISTGVPKVCLDYGKPSQKSLDRVTAAELKRYAAEGHFAPGSMLPKIEAVLRFVERGGREAVITNPESLGDAIQGKNGTHIVTG
ncbi:MAG: carbamate kinase [Synergistaceae bacterium]|jgi:carbamate kinase|nr:carbamate kinase [Synergistaceae bacterium]